MNSNPTNQVVVATIPSLEGQEIEEYGYRLGRHWGIGQKDKNNGVLLIVAPQERRVRIEVGYGLEGTLTDALSSRIVKQEILPWFRKGTNGDGHQTRRLRHHFYLGRKNRRQSETQTPNARTIDVGRWVSLFSSL